MLGQHNRRLIAHDVGHSRGEGGMFKQGQEGETKERFALVAQPSLTRLVWLWQMHRTSLPFVLLLAWELTVTITEKCLAVKGLMPNQDTAIKQQRQASSQLNPSDYYRTTLV